MRTLVALAAVSVTLGGTLAFASPASAHLDRERLVEVRQASSPRATTPRCSAATSSTSRPARARPRSPAASCGPPRSSSPAASTRSGCGTSRDATDPTLGRHAAAGPVRERGDELRRAEDVDGHPALRAGRGRRGPGRRPTDIRARQRRRRGAAHRRRHRPGQPGHPVPRARHHQHPHRRLRRRDRLPLRLLRRRQRRQLLDLRPARPRRTRARSTPTRPTPGVQPFSSPTAGHKWNFDDAGYGTHTGWDGSSIWDVARPAATRGWSPRPAPPARAPTRVRGLQRLHPPQLVPPQRRPVQAGPARPSFANGNVLLVTEEDYEQTDCSLAGSFQTWHVKRLNGTPSAIVPLDKVELSDLGNFPLPQGTFCSAHWFDYHPCGIVAVGFYGGGTQLIDAREPARPQVLRPRPLGRLGGLGRHVGPGVRRARAARRAGRPTCSTPSTWSAGSTSTPSTCPVTVAAPAPAPGPAAACSDSPSTAPVEPAVPMGLARSGPASPHRDRRGDSTLRAVGRRDRRG